MQKLKIGRTYAFSLKVPLIRGGEAHTGNFIPGEVHTDFIPLILIL